MQVVLGILLEALGSLVAPARCAACDASVRRATAFCPGCASTLVRASNPDPTRIAAFDYGAAIAQTLRRYKFDDRPDLARALVAGLAVELPRLRLAGIDVVVPVPLHPSRLVERGYNQAALIARPLARLLEVPWAPRALARTIATRRQTELTRAERAVNVERAFVTRDRAPIAGRTVLVVDDVETTGATLAACRRALVTAGSAATLTAVVARAQEQEGPGAADAQAVDGERHILRGTAL